MQRWREYARRGRAVIAAAALSVALLLVAVPRSSAHDFDDLNRCQQRVERAEARLDRAIWQHGLYSRQAQRRRYELAQARQRCWREHRVWWDSRSNHWRSDRDWDRDDWNRDPR